VELIDWLVGAGSLSTILLGLLLYVLLVPHGRDTLLYWGSSVLSVFAFARRVRAASYIQKEGEKFRAALNRDVEGLVDAPLKIEWVKGETQERFLEHGQCVVRIKDHGARHRNLTAATLLYVRGAVLPQARSYLGPDLSSAVDLTLTKKLLKPHRDALLHFVQNVESPQVRREPEVRDFSMQLEEMEDRGFMTRMFLREAKDVTTYIFPRQATEDHVQEWADFAHFLHSIATRRRGEKAELWFRSEHLTISVGLVAATETLKESGIEAYVAASRRAIDHGADAVYLCSFGRHHGVARSVAKRLRDHNQIEAIIECPACRIMHPFAEEPTPVNASFIVIYTRNRLRLARGAQPIEGQEN